MGYVGLAEYYSYLKEAIQDASRFLDSATFGVSTVSFAAKSGDALYSASMARATTDPTTKELKNDSF